MDAHYHLDALEDIRRQEQEERKEYIFACNKLASAVSSEPGKFLLAWLRENCFMTEPMNTEFIESAAFTQRVNGRRDLFIKLEQMIKDGALYVSGTE